MICPAVNPTGRYLVLFWFVFWVFCQEAVKICKPVSGYPLTRLKKSCLSAAPSLEIFNWNQSYSFLLGNLKGVQSAIPSVTTSRQVSSNLSYPDLARPFISDANLPVFRYADADLFPVAERSFLILIVDGHFELFFSFPSTIPDATKRASYHRQNLSDYLYFSTTIFARTQSCMFEKESNLEHIGHQPEEPQQQRLHTDI